MKGLLRLISSPASLPPPAPDTRAPAGYGQAPWPMLSESVDPMETAARIRAQSYLCGFVYRDGKTNPDTLTLSQAIDVIAWNNRSHP